MTDPGFYTDPTDPDRERFWDGEQWTDRTQTPGQQATGRQRSIAALIDTLLIGGVMSFISGIVAPALQALFFVDWGSFQRTLYMDAYNTVITLTAAVLSGLLVFAVAARAIGSSPGQRLVGIRPLNSDGDPIRGGKVALWVFATGAIPALLTSAALLPASSLMFSATSVLGGLAVGAAFVTFRLGFRLLGSITAPLTGGRWLGELVTGTTLTQRP